MSVLYAVSFFLSEAVRWSWIAAQFISFVMGVWALIDSLMRPAEHYAAAGKNTKRFWNVVNAVGTAVVGLLGAASMFGLLGVVASAVYLVDVRPALQALAPVRVRCRRRFLQVWRGIRQWHARRFALRLALRLPEKFASRHRLATRNPVR